MSQRPITSFFSVMSKKPVTDEIVSKPKNSVQNEEDSPIKTKKKRSRVAILSDSEEEVDTKQGENQSNGVNNKHEDEISSEEKENGVKSEPESSDETSSTKKVSKSKRKKSECSDEEDNVEKQKKKKSKTASPIQSENEEETSRKSVSPDKKKKSPPKKKEKSPVGKEKSKQKTPEKEDSKTPNKIAKDKSVKKEPKSAKKDIKEEPKSAKKDIKDEKTDKKETKSTLTSSHVKGADYDPNPTKTYHPIDDAIWKQGEKVPYLALCRTLQEIEGISARLKIIEILSNYFRSVIVLSPNDLLPSVYLCLNKLAPAYKGVELGIADTYLMKAISQCTGRSMAQLKTDAAAMGDLGLIAEKSKSNQSMLMQPAILTIQTVFEKLKEISQLSGKDCISKKVDKIQALFRACRHCEARYLIRSLAGKLRIGLAEQSVLQALALACTMTPPDQEYPPEVLNKAKESKMSQEQFKAYVDKEALILKTTYCECPNYDMIMPILLKKGIHGLPEHCKLTPSIPLKPMLAHPTKGIQEVLKRFENINFTCEWKYDGERAQIHYSDGEISIFSRNQEDNTSKFPDIITNLKATLDTDLVKSCILDTEAVAWDRVNKKILPFQILSTRKRKDAVEADITVQVCVFMFDLLYLNGKPLVKEPFGTRRKLLKEHFKETEGQFLFATSLDTDNMETVQEFLDESVKGNCEGLMVKTLDTDATYEIAKRSHNWLKLKKDYLDGVGDTIDVVVLGGYLGRGKRTGLYGGFLLACYDPENEEFQSLCKIGTGFSDEDLTNHSEHFKPHIIPNPKPYYRFDNSLSPDHWFDAVTVWEIKCADLSLSPIHKAAQGIVDPEKGISLRFPRFLRIRDDKTVEAATSARQIAEMYQNQDQILNQQTTTSKINEEDFY